MFKAFLPKTILELRKRTSKNSKKHPFIFPSEPLASRQGWAVIMIYSSPGTSELESPVQIL